MIRRLRGAISGEPREEVADTAVGRGMADLLAALDDVIDDAAALDRVYAELGKNAPAAAPSRCTGMAAAERCARIGVPGSASTWAHSSAPAASPRRLALRSAAAVAAVLTTSAVILEAILVPEAVHNGTDGLAVNAAFVVKRMSSALSAADRGELAQMTVTTRSGTSSAAETEAASIQEWSHGDQWRSVMNSPGGHVLYDEGSSTASLYILVSYLTRTWARQPGLGHPSAGRPGSQSCASIVVALPFLFPPRLPSAGVAARSLLTVVGYLRAVVSCGTLKAAGRLRIDGIEAIELTSPPSTMVSETIWVSPGTYLPVRVVIRPVHGKPGPVQTAGITWIRPTGANLARMTVPIPAGFRQVSLAEAAGPIALRTSVTTPLAA